MTNRPTMESTGQRRRPALGGSAVGMIAGAAMALAMGMRVLMPLFRSLGPQVRSVLLLLIALGVAAALGLRTWRRKGEQREIAAARARRAELRARRALRKSNEVADASVEPAVQPRPSAPD